MVLGYLLRVTPGGGVSESPLQPASRNVASFTATRCAMARCPGMDIRIVVCPFSSHAGGNDLPRSSFSELKRPAAAFSRQMRSSCLILPASFASYYRDDCPIPPQKATWSCAHEAHPGCNQRSNVRCVHKLLHEIAGFLPVAGKSLQSGKPVRAMTAEPRSPVIHYDKAGPSPHESRTPRCPWPAPSSERARFRPETSRRAL